MEEEHLQVALGDIGDVGATGGAAVSQGEAGDCEAGATIGLDEHCIECNASGRRQSDGVCLLRQSRSRWRAAGHRNWLLRPVRPFLALLEWHTDL